MQWYYLGIAATPVAIYLAAKLLLLCQYQGELSHAKLLSQVGDDCAGRRVGLHWQRHSTALVRPCHWT